MVAGGGCDGGAEDVVGMVETRRDEGDGWKVWGRRARRLRRHELQSMTGDMMMILGSRLSILRPVDVGVANCDH